MNIIIKTNIKSSINNLINFIININIDYIFNIILMFSICKHVFGKNMNKYIKKESDRIPRLTNILIRTIKE